MDDYIKREDAIYEIDKAFENAEKAKSAMTKMLLSAAQITVGSILRDMTAADVVEVVRCKNCKHSHLMFNKALICWNCNSNVKFPISADDFCCHGERRTDNE